MEDKDLNAYQLYAEVLRQLGMGGGVLSRYHQQMSGKEGYMDGLNLLEYDMLYGEFYCYGGENPYTASELQMGVAPVVISDAVWADGVLTVYGENFTRWSCVAIDGKNLPTVFADAGTLTVEWKEPPGNGAVITVRQNTASSATLSESLGLPWNA